MKCALCLKESVLRRSHIIPEFLYETLYDEKHRLQVLSILPDQGNWLEQKGLYERLLCDDCEQHLNVWETYASLVLKGDASLTYRTEHNLVYISGLNYSHFKLFQLSVLWRASASSLPFFEKVQLGKHAEIIRTMLLTGNPGSPDRYGCFMFGLKYKNRALTDVIVQPLVTRLCGQVAYKFVFGGFIWAMLVSSQALCGPASLCTLRPNGDFTLLVRDALEMEDLASFGLELERLGRKQ